MYFKMKTSVVVIFFFACQFNVLAQKYYNDEKQGNYEELKYNSGYEERNLKKNEYFDEEGKKYETEKLFGNKKRNDEDYDDDDDPGNPDKHAIIVRPCAFFDRFCIRKFLATHSKCLIVPGPIKEPFFVEENQLYLANNNITTTFIDNTFSNLNGRIDEFYYNKVTGNLVLSVFFDALKAESKRNYFRFDRNGQEPIETVGLAAIDFLKCTITIVIPNYKNLRLEDAEVNGYLDDPFPPFVVGPGALESTDPVVAADFASVFADIPTAALETLSTIAPLVAKIFVQRSLCDFGVPISKL